MVRSSHVGYAQVMNATTKSVITSGKLEIFFKPGVSELGACQCKNVSDAMDVAKDKPVSQEHKNTSTDKNAYWETA